MFKYFLIHFKIKSKIRPLVLLLCSKDDEPLFSLATNSGIYCMLRSHKISRDYVLAFFFESLYVLFMKPPHKKPSTITPFQPVRV